MSNDTSEPAAQGGTPAAVPADTTPSAAATQAGGPAASGTETSAAAGSQAAGSAPGTVQIRLATLLQAVAAVALVALTVTFGLLWWSARSTNHDHDAQAAADRHAEQVATDYAVGASNFNYQDFDAWVGKLKSGTAPQLGAKFDATAGALKQLLVPLQGTTSATPITAKVVDRANGYTVDVFLNVTSTSAQNPDGKQSTVNYTVHLDPNNNWVITDVGGVTDMLPTKK
ncbi:hypothetical protein [Nocardia stercoris]|uniref:Mce-associated membrane protein n=1 Tax=Nocardia stercoris TaxID=2483361 RepID=A0A3M2L4V7_9NOCA|nr:hypothetical protein [Nocardia stercoris]RMI32722.1 hypothetical protein EBN03_12240 [Nocardia stercoris]